MKKGDRFSATNICVKCGLCLPHCPTYQLTLDENESPRGRIALIQGSAEGKLSVNSKLLKHLDSCLMCRSCENVCPASVPYGQLLDEHRALFGKNPPAILARAKNFVFRRILQTKKRTRFFNAVIRRYQNSRFRHALEKIASAMGHRGASFDALLPAVKAYTERPECYPPGADQIGSISLFTGCTGNLIDGETIDAAILLATQLGYRVAIPKGQSCCGALHLHSGQVENARKHFQINVRSFRRESSDAIVTIASGCGAMLKEYSIYQDLSAESKAFSSKVHDICHFLAGGLETKSLSFKPTSAKVYLHTPCSLKNVMREAQGVRRLLNNISGLELAAQPESINCCGAAGSYMVEYPMKANAIRARLLDSVEATKPEYLVTSNIGCALHIRAGLGDRGIRNIEVLHPVVFAARRLNSFWK